jgi:hypothetical protein
VNYLFNLTNVIRNALLSATNIVASQSVFRTDTAAKLGNGIVELDGSYTGQHNSLFEIEIVDATGDSSQVSEPVFTGIGNGAMTNVSATGLDAQTIGVSLVDLGTPTTFASAPFQGVLLQALTSGFDGNLIAISVDDNDLVRTLSDTYSVPVSGLSASTNEYVGSQYDFGAGVLKQSGEIDEATTPRLSFGVNPRVFRQYKKFDPIAGQYVFSFSPPLDRDVEGGESVHVVTGTWNVHLADGVNPNEDYPGVVTLYDALVDIDSTSDLVEVIGAIANDLKPGGMGVNDLSVWTQSEIFSITGDGSIYVTRYDPDVTAAANAPSELVTLECTDATHIGAEVWAVNGSVSGPLGNAVSGAAFAAGAYDILIPQRLPPDTDPGQAPTGDILVELILRAGTRPSTPQICVDSPRLGSMAHDGVWEFEYHIRPEDPCPCEDAPLSGGPTNECLGIEPEGGVDMAEQRAIVRLQQLAEEVRIITASNTSGNPLNPRGDSPEVQTVLKTAAVLKDCLSQIGGGTLTYSPWAATHDYTVDSIVVSPSLNGYRYRAIVGGISAGSAPTFPTTVGATVTDGSVVWKNIGKFPYEMWDAMFYQWSSEMENFMKIELAPVYPAWTATTVTPVGMIVIPTVRNGHFYGLAQPGTTGGIQPTWPTDGTTVADGTAIWVDLGPYWSPDAYYLASSVIFPGDGFKYFVATAMQGFSDSTEPDWPAVEADTIVDGEITWTASRRSASGFDQTDAVIQRYKTMATEVLAAAGIDDKNFDSAGIDGCACWQDNNDHAWWEYRGTDIPYLPIQNSIYYSTAAKSLTPEGAATCVPTFEWAFGPKISCIDSLLEGDIIRVTVRNTGISAPNGGARGYQQGDSWNIEVVHAEPIPLSGGQSGDDTLTFRVTGGIDAFIDYPLDLNAPVPYSNNGLTFEITPGGIPFALSDRFDFAIEGGHFHWRRDGGSWSSDLPIGDTLLVDGLTAVFIGGAAPSWKALDKWTFLAEAINGPDGLRTPRDPRLKWTGSTVIDIEPDGGPAAASGVFLGDLAIGATATVHVLGSDDDFATTPTDVTATVPAGTSSVWIPFPLVTRAAWRITVNVAGTLQWAHLGEPADIAMPNNKPELGRFLRRVRLPGNGISRGDGGEISHSALISASLDELLDGISYARAFDDGLFGMATGSANPIAGLVRYVDDSLEVEELLDHELTDPDDWLHSVTLRVEPGP